MGICGCAGEQIFAKEIIADRYRRRILQNGCVVSRVAWMIVMASDCHAGAGASDRRMLRVDQVVQRRTDRLAFEVVHVVLLVAAGDEYHLGPPNGFADAGVVAFSGRVDEQRLYRIHGAQSKNVAVVSIGPGGPQHHDITAAGLADHPLNRRVNTGPATHQHRAAAGSRDAVGAASNLAQIHTSKQGAWPSHAAANRK